MPDARVVAALLAAYPDASVCLIDRELRVVEALSHLDPARWGYASRDLVGRPLRELLGEEEFARVRVYANQAFASGEPLRYEMGFELPPGRTWLEVRLTPVRGEDGAVRHLLTVGLDVSERRRTEERLRESEGRFAALARSLPVGVFRSDAATRLEYANERFWEILGLEPGRLIGLDQHAHAALAEAEGNVAPGEAVGHWPDATQPGTLDVEVRWHRPHDGGRWLRVRSESQHAADGAFVGRVGAIVDVTDLKRAEEELAVHHDRLNTLVVERTTALERTHEALRRSERLAAVGSFAAGIAHQINNPVGGILLAAQYALGAPEDRARMREALLDIAQDARHCGRIVRGVLEFARGPKGAACPCDLNAIARRCVLEIATDARERGASLRLDLEAGLPPVAGSGPALEQVLVNLVWSAIEASAREVVVRSRAGEGGIELAVVDDGIARLPVAPVSAFDALGAGGGLRRGTGLGLALAQGIAQAHGASVEVRGGPARGNSVSVCFPRWA